MGSSGIHCFCDSGYANLEGEDHRFGYDAAIFVGQNPVILHYIVADVTFICRIYHQRLACFEVCDSRDGLKHGEGHQCINTFACYIFRPLGHVYCDWERLADNEGNICNSGRGQRRDNAIFNFGLKSCYVRSGLQVSYQADAQQDVVLPDTVLVCAAQGDSARSEEHQVVGVGGCVD